MTPNGSYIWPCRREVNAARGLFGRERPCARTWITPLYHKTTDADGTLRHVHALPYFQTRNYKAVFPVYWRWRSSRGEVRSMIPLLYTSRRTSAGDVRRSFLWPLVAYRRGRELDTSLSFDLKPFTYQRAGSDRELKFLWRFPLVRIVPFLEGRARDGRTPSPVCVDMRASANKDAQD